MNSPEILPASGLACLDGIRQAEIDFAAGVYRGEDLAASLYTGAERLAYAGAYEMEYEDLRESKRTKQEKNDL